MAPLTPASLSPDALGWLLLVAGVVLAAATLEGIILTLRRHHYDWRNYFATLGVVVGRRLVDATGLSLAWPVVNWAWTHRLTTLSLDHWAQFALLFFGQEFFYYLYHRASHRMRWFWASHCVHHSPNELTLATALRLGWTARLTGTALFFTPLIWLGFHPVAVLGCLTLNLLYQFWLHAPWLPKLGPLEWVLNTPAHHRVHHASNKEYLDCNFGGVLIIFDRLFGTFVAEQPGLPIRYGLTTPLHSYNPIRIALHGWLELWRELKAAPSLAHGLRLLVSPPTATEATQALTSKTGP
jgi:sterol desaturase/sphingolipid hydroxylase (fatty acid hydroxylase superfamily)